jgi:hypothetical protein
MTTIGQNMPLGALRDETKGRGIQAVALGLMALAIALPGAVGLFAPGLLAGPAAVGIDILNEARAVGGTRLGAAVVLALAAFTPAWRRAGLVAGLVIFGATLFGRLVSNGLDGIPGPMLKPEVAEVVLITLASIALRMGGSSSRPTPR